MKSLGEYTIRGQVPAGVASVRVNLFDGSYATGFKVKEFYVGPNKVESTVGNSYSIKLATEENLPFAFRWDWNKNTEIAWASMSFDANGIMGTPMNVVDPDNMIVEDLFIYAYNNSGEAMNYMVVMEKFDIGLTKGAYTLVRNNSQNFPDA